MAREKTEVLIAGGGLAGLTTAYELLERGCSSILMLEKGKRDDWGGMAKASFGGVHMIGTPEQRRMGLKDSPELAYKDWESFALFESGDEWPRKWARFYCENSREYIYDFLRHKRIKFLPLVNWPERGLYRPGNTLPRWHITWGTGYEIILKLLAALDAHPKRANLEVLFEHEVSALETSNGRVTGVSGKSMADGKPFTAHAEHVIVATGGICGGDMSKVRANWYKPWGAPPKILLNGSHIYADGMMQDRVAAMGGNVTHLDKQWHYAAGVHHPAKTRPNDGLSLLPPRSALWMNARGERIGPVPLMGYTDMRWIVEQLLKEPGGYSWQVMNWKIGIKEMAVSGCDYMTAFRKKSKLMLLGQMLFGNKELMARLIRECTDDIVTADTLPKLVDKMNTKGLEGLTVDLKTMEAAITEYDDQIDRGPTYHVDDQLRRITQFRRFSGDRFRMCKHQKILDPGARPLIAIREFILSRKSLGGIQTDLACRVLKPDGTAISGLYAVGESAGFGGGGIHGLGSLEGTFLGSCVLTGRVAAQKLLRG